MKSEDDRDRAVERLLRQSSAGAMGSPRQDGCLDAEIAAAWVDGNLLPHERAAVESHASECARCQAIVATLARTTPAGPTAAPWWQRQWRWGWLVPLTAGAAAVILWVVTPNEALRPPSEPRDVGMQSTTQALKQEPAALADRFEQEAPSNDERAAAALTSQAREKTTSDTGRADEADAAGGLPSTTAESTTADRMEANQAASVAAVEGITASARAPVAPAPGANAALLSRESEIAEAVTVAVDIVSPDSAIRWRIGAPGVVQYSDDGGATWQSLATGVAAALTAGVSPSSSVCWLVGRAGTVLLTTDSRQWRRLAFAEEVDLAAVQALDARTATIVAGDGRRFRTTDGGTTWVQLPLQEF